MVSEVAHGDALSPVIRVFDQISEEEAAILPMDKLHGLHLEPPLPPNPPIDLAKLSRLHDEANLALGRLDGVTTILPDADLFLYAYVRKEAVLSSQIEGTQSSLSDLLLFENEAAPGVPLDDVQEVSNYVAAMRQPQRPASPRASPIRAPW